MKLKDTAIGQRFRYITARIRAWSGRVTRFGLFLRTIILLAGIMALWLAIGPSNIRMLPIALIVPCIAMMRPKPLWVSFTMFVALISWCFSTIGDREASIWVAAAIGICLYIHHAAAALAVQWRADTAVSVKVQRSWVFRLVTISVSSLLGTAIVWAFDYTPIALPHEIAVVGAVLLTIAIIAFLGYLGKGVPPETENGSRP